jgi:uncharacterized protein
MEAGMEYLGAMPYIARGRQNMTAMLMVRNDEARYGELTLLEFPRDQQVAGPAQVQAMIEQDPVIAPELSLLRQRGSQIDMGKLRVLPLDSTVLYVQPFFLSADENPIPEIWGIVASDGRSISLGQSLQGGGGGLRGGRRPRAPWGRAWQASHDAPGPAPGLQGTELWSPGAGPPGAGRGRLRAGDWAGYGRAWTELRELLEE